MCARVVVSSKQRISLAKKKHTSLLFRLVEDPRKSKRGFSHARRLLLVPIYRLLVNFAHLKTLLADALIRQLDGLPNVVSGP